MHQIKHCSVLLTAQSYCQEQFEDLCCWFFVFALLPTVNQTREGGCMLSDSLKVVWTSLRLADHDVVVTTYSLVSKEIPVQKEEAEKPVQEAEDVVRERDLSPSVL